MGAYGRDLAQIHDAGFGDFSRRAAPGLRRLLKQHRIARGLIVDLGCGSGVWAASAIRAGYRVLGIDISAAMLAIARKRAPDGIFRRGSLLSARLPTCDAVTSLGECLNYRFDDRNSKAALKRLFRRVRAALRPGGRFIFDLLEPGYLGPGHLRLGFHEGPGWAVVVQVEESPHRPELIRRIGTFREAGRRYRLDHEVHHLRLYDAAWIAADLRRAGFRVRRLRGYGSLRFDRRHVGFVARRPPGRGSDSSA